jgi:hypothetical protein
MGTRMKKLFHEALSVMNQRGAIAILVTGALVVLLGFTALAIDVGHLVVARNELKNAADAGALAGARFLYNNDGTAVNTGANQIAYDAATANTSQKDTSGLPLPVEVEWNSGNTGDVQRGHWSFGLGDLPRGFYPNNSTDPFDLWNISTEELDESEDFINAIRVVTRRKTTMVESYFARIFGHHGYEFSAHAVAYIGFAGTLRPEDVNQPIGICKQAIVDEEGNYTCNTGRMIDSGGGTTHNTGAWTNFSQPCETASVPTVKPLVCADGNPEMLNFGDGMGTVGGMQDTVYNDLRDCWLNNDLLDQDWRGYPTKSWELTLAVLDCPGNNPGPCSELVGSVTLNIVWIKQSGSDPNWTDIPLKMEGWECSEWVNAGRPEDINALDSSQRHKCWQEFATEFNLYTADDTPVGDLTHSDILKTIFFLPDCTPHEPRGLSGGENFGILAKIPVLVN